METGSEPETEDSIYLKTNLSSKKKRKNKNNFHPKKSKIFEYLNKDAKKHKR